MYFRLKLVIFRASQTHWFLLFSCRTTWADCDEDRNLPRKHHEIMGASWEDGNTRNDKPVGFSVFLFVCWMAFASQRRFGFWTNSEVALSISLFCNIFVNFKTWGPRMDHQNCTFVLFWVVKIVISSPRILPDCPRKKHPLNLQESDSTGWKKKQANNFLGEVNYEPTITWGNFPPPKKAWLFWKRWIYNDLCGGKT